MAFSARAKSGGGPANMDPGSHPAVCVAVIDLGSHWVRYEDQKPKLKRQILLTFEIPKSAANPDGLQVLHKQYSVNLHEKAALRLDIENWLSITMKEGDDFDFTKLLGKGCLCLVKLSDEKWPKVESIAGLPRAVKTPKPVKTPFTWDLSQYNPKKRIPIPDWMPNLYGDSVEDKILASTEIAGDRARKPVQQSFDNDPAPF